MRTWERSTASKQGCGRRALFCVLAVGAIAAPLSACADEQEHTPLQQVDWRNGPYAQPCATDEAEQYADGRTVRQDGEQGSTELDLVGYAELDGREGDEAILTHLCVSGSVSLSVWTGSEDGPRLLGPVDEPEGYADTPEWGVDRGVLCVMLSLGDVPGRGAEARPVAVSASGPTVLVDQSCEIDGASGVEPQDVG